MLAQGVHLCCRDDDKEVLRDVGRLRARSDHYALQVHDPDNMDQLERRKLDLCTFDCTVVAVVVVVEAPEDETALRRVSFWVLAMASAADRKHFPD